MAAAFLVLLGVVFSAAFQYVLDHINRNKNHRMWVKERDREDLTLAMKNVMVAQAEIRQYLLHAKPGKPIPEEVFLLTERIDAEAQFIAEEDQRDIMEELSKIVWWADQIAKSQKKSKRDSELLARSIAWEMCNEIPVMAGKILRREIYVPQENYFEWRDIRQDLDLKATNF